MKNKKNSRADLKGVIKMERKDPKSIPANYYEPDYEGPGCALVIVLLISMLPLLGLFLVALSYMIS